MFSKLIPHGTGQCVVCENTLQTRWTWQNMKMLVFSVFLVLNEFGFGELKNNDIKKIKGRRFGRFEEITYLSFQNISKYRKNTHPS